MAADWLKDYYGKAFNELTPDVVKEGRNYAIVRLIGSNKNRAFSAIGYVLVKKNGRHGATPHQSLYEGVPSLVEFQGMVDKLNQAEARFTTDRSS